MFFQILPLSSHKLLPPRLLILFQNPPPPSSGILFNDFTNIATCPRLFPPPRLLILQLLHPLLVYSLLLGY